MGKVLHASYSGYFPACIQTAPASKGNLVSGTLEQIMELYWRVKAWRLDFVSGSIDIDGEIIDYSASQQALGAVSATTEADLVCNPAFGATATYTLNGQSRKLIIGLGGSYFIENTTYYLYFLFDMLFVTTQVTEYEVGFVTIKGFSVPLYGYVDGPPRPITGNITASISPIEYWSYGGTYNTSTGQPL